MSEPKPKFIIDEKGNKVSVILSIKEYNELLEDIHDLKIVMTCQPPIINTGVP